MGKNNKDEKLKHCNIMDYRWFFENVQFYITSDTDCKNFVFLCF